MKYVEDASENEQQGFAIGHPATPGRQGFGIDHPTLFANHDHAPSMITFLTRPLVPFRMREAKYAVLACVDRLRGRKARVLPAQGGHASVNRSVFEGLRQLGVPFNVDPPSLSEVHENVFCIADTRSLRQAIKWKRSGKISRLITGYTIAGDPSNDGGIILDPAIDRYVCFSDWHADSFDLRAPGFRSRAVVCPFGVDPEAWTPANPSGRAKTDILFFKKRAPWPLYEEALGKLRSMGYSVEELVYGKYALGDYRAALERNSLVVYWNNVETQGIAMAEAWAANAPTLVFNPREIRVIGNRLYTFQNDASPYLSSETGAFFSSMDELVQLLEQYRSGQLTFQPRPWVLANLTDVQCARHLVQTLDLGSLIPDGLRNDRASKG